MKCEYIDECDGKAPFCYLGDTDEDFLYEPIDHVCTEQLDEKMYRLIRKNFMYYLQNLRPEALNIVLQKVRSYERARESKPTV